MAQVDHFLGLLDEPEPQVGAETQGLLQADLSQIPAARSVLETAGREAALAGRPNQFAPPRAELTPEKKAQLKELYGTAISRFGDKANEVLKKALGPHAFQSVLAAAEIGPPGDVKQVFQGVQEFGKGVMDLDPVGALKGAAEGALGLLGPAGDVGSMAAKMAAAGAAIPAARMVEAQASARRAASGADTVPVQGTYTASSEKYVSDAATSPVNGQPGVMDPSTAATRISTAVPTAKTADREVTILRDPNRDNLRVDRPTMEMTSQAFGRNMEFLKDNLIGARIPRDASPSEVADLAMKHIQENFEFWHDLVPPEIASRSQLWYPGANRLSRDLATERGLPMSSSSGVIAALSPEKDWFQNADLARRVVTIMQDQLRTRMDASMRGRGDATFGYTGDKQAKIDINDAWQRVSGKSLGELDDPFEQAMWVRMFDMTHNSPKYNILTPEGDISHVSPTNIGWGYDTATAKAIRALRSDGDLAKISPAMGDVHKVRSFYNNIFDPHSPVGDTTIDTHAVNGGVFIPMNGKQPLVKHGLGNFGSASARTGAKGTYGIYADALRAATISRGLADPRAMQSITWEVVRDMMDKKKGTEFVDFAKTLWRQVDAGQITAPTARGLIAEKFGGYRPPSWSTSGPGGQR